MAKLSQAFLSSLGRPAMTQSLFDLGTAIGNVPNQYQEKKKRDADAAELSKHPEGSTQQLLIMAKHAARDGDRQLASQLVQRVKEMKALEVTQGQNALKAQMDAITFQQQQIALAEERAGTQLQSRAVIEDINSLMSGQGVPNSVRVRAAGVLKHALKSPDSAHTLRATVDQMLADAGKDPQTFTAINFVNPSNPLEIKAVRSDDEKGIQALMDAGWVKGSALNQNGSNELVIEEGPDGTKVIRFGKSSATAGEQTRDSGIANQNENLRGQVSQFREKIKSLRNPEAAFGVRGAAQDPDTPLGAAINIMMQFDAGEMTVEALSAAIGQKLTKEDVAEIKAARSSLANLQANARNVSRGVQDDRNASASEIELSKKVIRGLDAADTLDDVLASLDNFEELLDIREGAVGGGNSIPKVSSQKDYDSLPSGAIYIEDGETYRKP